jgi:hypothetical protein
MKKLKTLVPLIFLALMVFGMTSCVVLANDNNGRHRGWFHQNDNHRSDRKFYLFKQNNHRQPSSNHDNRPKGRNKDK